MMSNIMIHNMANMMAEDTGLFELECVSKFEPPAYYARRIRIQPR